MSTDSKPPSKTQHNQAPKKPTVRAIADHVRDPEDPTFLKLWNDLYHGVGNNFVDSLLLEMARMAGYGYCADDLVSMVKTSQPKPVENNRDNDNEIE